MKKNYSATLKTTTTTATSGSKPSSLRFFILETTQEAENISEKLTLQELMLTEVADGRPQNILKPNTCKHIQKILSKV